MDFIPFRNIDNVTSSDEQVISFVDNLKSKSIFFQDEWKKKIDGFWWLSFLHPQITFHIICHPFSKFCRFTKNILEEVA